MSANGQHRLVLVCDSDLHSVRGLRSVLRDAGLDVCVTQTADDALTRAALRIPDAAIIEMDVSDSSGSEVCRQLRQWSSMPIVMLSHTSDEDRVIEALGAGANDYIGKPFRPRELVARLEAHMRRTSVEDNDPVLVLSDGVRIDLPARRVHRDDDEIKLTPIEYRLLSALLRARGRLLTHDDLLREVWGVAHAEDRQTLRAHVANLRRKLSSPKASGVIRTYPGVGYLFDNRTGESAPQQPPDISRVEPSRVVRVWRTWREAPGKSAASHRPPGQAFRKYGTIVRGDRALIAKPSVLTANSYRRQGGEMSEGMQPPMHDQMAGSKQMDKSPEEETSRPMGDNMDSMDDSRNKRTDDPMKRDQDDAADMDKEMKDPMTHDMDAP